ncbi:MAG: ATP-binding protein [Oscillospiraceae bacterium]|nr:ATP-binding protein [Oscillospiraceae bacterium]
MIDDFIDTSEANFLCDQISDKWYYNRNHWKNQIYDNKRQHSKVNNIDVNGMYEGSLFVGTRFQDSKRFDDLLNDNSITLNDLVSADDYIIRKLSYILHGDFIHYTSLKRLKNRELSQKHGLKNLPYFIESSYGGLISQYRMSSGECLLVSLLHFIYNAIERSSLPKNRPVLMLMDEIELALHPVAVSRLLDLLEEIVKKHKNVVAVLTTHAPEVIRRISPSNIYKLKNEDGIVTANSPCYPSYAIRELYTHDSYDYLILCEDALARRFIERVIDDEDLRLSKLICVLPVGGWENVLKLHIELSSNSILNAGTKIISVLDGDVMNKCNAKPEFKDLLKLFIPIPSIEKYLYDIIYNSSNKTMKKTIGDKYFQLKSIATIIADYNKEYPNTPKQPHKSFYRFLIKDLSSRKIEENVFVEKLCGEIISNVNSSSFKKSLSDELM